MQQQNKKRIILGISYLLCSAVFLFILYVLKPVISLTELMTLTVRGNLHSVTTPILDFQNSNFLYNAVLSSVPDIQFWAYSFSVNIFIVSLISLLIIAVVFFTPEIFTSFCIGIFIISGFCLSNIYLSRTHLLWFPLVWPLLVLSFILVSSLVMKIQAKQNRLISTIKLFGYDINLFPNSIVSVKNIVKEPKKTEVSLCYFKIKIPQSFVDDNFSTDVAGIVNIPFGIIVDTVLANSGIIHKTSSSEIVAYWLGKNNAYRSVKTAMEIQNLLKEKFYNEKENSIIKVSCGINTDISVFAILGSKKFSNYAVIGNSYDIAVRLESACVFHDSEILISQKTFENIKDKIIATNKGILSITGKQEPLNFYEPESFINDKMSYLDKLRGDKEND